MQHADTGNKLVDVIQLQDRIGIAILHILPEYIQLLAGTKRMAPFRIHSG